MDVPYQEIYKSTIDWKVNLLKKNIEIINEVDVTDYFINRDLEECAEYLESLSKEGFKRIHFDGYDVCIWVTK